MPSSSKNQKQQNEVTVHFATSQLPKQALAMWSVHSATFWTCLEHWDMNMCIYRKYVLSFSVCVTHSPMFYVTCFLYFMICLRDLDSAYWQTQSCFTCFIRCGCSWYPTFWHHISSCGCPIVCFVSFSQMGICLVSEFSLFCRVLGPQASLHRLF